MRRSRAVRCLSRVARHCAACTRRRADGRQSGPADAAVGVVASCGRLSVRGKGVYCASFIFWHLTDLLLLRPRSPRSPNSMRIGWCSTCRCRRARFACSTTPMYDFSIACVFACGNIETVLLLCCSIPLMLLLSVAMMRMSTQLHIIFPLYVLSSFLTQYCASPGCSTGAFNQFFRGMAFDFIDGATPQPLNRQYRVAAMGSIHRVRSRFVSCGAVLFLRGLWLYLVGSRSR